LNRMIDITPPDSARVKSWTRALALRYAGLLEVSSIGESLLGREIIALEMGNIHPEKAVLYCGGIHGREWVTTLLLMYFAEELLAGCAGGRRMCDMDVRRMLDSRGLVIVPALNPDGIEISVSGEPPAVLLCGGSLNPESLGRWKANARGVDINRNFDSGWDEMRLSALERGITGPSPEGWTGSFPESEPETRAIVALCEEKRFRHLIAFHSQGEVIYWNYRNYTPPIARLMAGILSMSSGYALGEPARSAGAAGMKDWFMEKYGKPAFTVEVGRGDCPIPLSGFPFLYRRLKEMLMLGIAM
jgi:Predicted carboxypeptidase